MYLGMLDALAAEYPDALIVQTHRAPVDFLGSVSSVHAKMWGAATDHIDLPAIGVDQMALASRVIERGMQVQSLRASNPLPPGIGPSSVRLDAWAAL